MIHQVLISLVLLAQFYLDADLKKISIVLLATLGASLLIQSLVHHFWPQLYGNKFKN
ncbi:MAG TPA: hypothetical protein VM010_01905 [Chitinophagaceae bacterium]|nr:hypothetical protein [Chitinophagaceae bacterium]